MCQRMWYPTNVIIEWWGVDIYFNENKSLYNKSFFFFSLHYERKIAWDTLQNQVTIRSFLSHASSWWSTRQSFLDTVTAHRGKAALPPQFHIQVLLLLFYNLEVCTMPWLSGTGREKQLQKHKGKSMVKVREGRHLFQINSSLLSRGYL